MFTLTYKDRQGKTVVLDNYADSRSAERHAKLLSNAGECKEYKITLRNSIDEQSMDNYKSEIKYVAKRRL